MAFDEINVKFDAEVLFSKDVFTCLWPTSGVASWAEPADVPNAVVVPDPRDNSSMLYDRYLFKCIAFKWCPYLIRGSVLLKSAKVAGLKADWTQGRPAPIVCGSILRKIEQI